MINPFPDTLFKGNYYHKSGKNKGISIVVTIQIKLSINRSRGISNPFLMTIVKLTR